MKTKPKYQQIIGASESEIKKMFKSGFRSAVTEALWSLTCNDINWKFAFDACVKYSTDKDHIIRLAAIHGISNIGRWHKAPPKNMVKPVLLMALKDSDEEVRFAAEEVIGEYNDWFKWNIGRKALKMKAT